jgi:Flp pilus assembly pilin Flp
MTGTQHNRPPALRDDQAGQTMVEYALLLAVFGLPMFFVFARLLEVLAAYFGMISFMQTLPLP